LFPHGADDMYGPGRCGRSFGDVAKIGGTLSDEALSEREGVAGTRHAGVECSLLKLALAYSATMIFAAAMALAALDLDQ